MQIEEIYRPPQADLENRPAPQAEQLPPFFQTSISKMVLLSFFTMGFYEIFWFYEHWLRRRAFGAEVSPLARAIFAPLFAYTLFKTVNEEVEARQVPVQPLASGWLAFAYVLPVLSSFLPDPLSWLGLLRLVPILFVQKKINELHGAMGFDPEAGSSYTSATATAMVLGAIVWILFLIALLSPPS